MRFANPFFTVAATAILVASLALATGCRSGGAEAQSADGQAAPEKAAAPPKGVAPPADHRMAQVRLGMSTDEVEKVMGRPSNEKSYITGKAFNPFNYGTDSGSRVEYAYSGEGRVVFAVHRYTGRLKVERIDYDPNEAGN